jgi:hypothetical protein
MQVLANPAIKESLGFLAKANQLHVRTGSASGEIYKTPPEIEAKLLPLSGSMFSLENVEFMAQRGKTSNRTNQVTGEKYTVSTNTTEVLCKVNIKHLATNATFDVRMKLGEIASADTTTGHIVLFFERVGTKKNEAGDITEQGQFWAHAEKGASIEQQAAFIAMAVEPVAAPVVGP